jgi:hypothetical protein
MPSATLYHYLRSFGLGQLTDIGLPGESAGLLPKGTDWQRITHDTIAFGQGLSVNTVQMAAALAAVANGGVRIDPSLIAGTIDANGELTPAPAPQQHRVISARAAHAVGRMMEEVTGPNGTAPAAAIPGYRVAGKTGTAQRAGRGWLPRLHDLLRRVRPGRQATIPDLHRHPGPQGRQRRRFGRRPGVPRHHGLRPAEVRRRADRLDGPQAPDDLVSADSLTPVPAQPQATAAMPMRPSHVRPWRLRDIAEWLGVTAPDADPQP